MVYFFSLNYYLFNKIYNQAEWKRMHNNWIIILYWEDKVGIGLGGIKL
jgi:hypothetical protein